MTWKVLIENIHTGRFIIDNTKITIKYNILYKFIIDNTKIIIDIQKCR